MQLVEREIRRESTNLVGAGSLIARQTYLPWGTIVNEIQVPPHGYVRFIRSPKLVCVCVWVGARSFAFDALKTKQHGYQLQK